MLSFPQKNILMTESPISLNVAVKLEFSPQILASSAFVGTRYMFNELPLSAYIIKSPERQKSELCRFDPFGTEINRR